MANFRKVKTSNTAPEVMMGSIKLRQPIPMFGMRQWSPFILLHHFDFMFSPGHNQFDVPAHPHRGFCPVTFMFEGSVEHNDSLGNSSVIGSNEVQWINAARGIIHSERAAKDFIETGGRFQGIQLWINVPATEKMLPPMYKAITGNELVLIETDGAELRVVSGRYGDKKGPAPSEVFTATLRMKKDSSFAFEVPAMDNCAIYILEGEVKINDSEPGLQHQFVCFENSEGEVQLHATHASKLLMLSGTPINEPLVTHGPFVMNTQTEILEAMRDYQEGKMGYMY